MILPIHYEPRDYQKGILKAVADPTIRYIDMVWARRNGKDMTSINAVIPEMVRNPIKVSYVYPLIDQGRRNLWENVENDGFRTIDHFPKELIKRMNNSSMTIEFKNGSIFEVRGTNTQESVDNLRGANSKIYVFSEFADIHPGALSVVRPVIIRNNGKLIINGTPKIDGINGAAFKNQYEHHKTMKNAYVSLRDARGIMSEEDLEEERQNSIAEWGNDFFFRQEYLLDWGQVSVGTYYGDKIGQMEGNGKIGSHPYNPQYPVYTAWDLGMSDDIAIWFFQIYNGVCHFIDFSSSNDVGVQSYLKYVTSQPYVYADHYFPWDAAKRDQYDANSTISSIKNGGIVNVQMLRRMSVETGIKNVASNLSKCTFDINNPHVEKAIHIIKLYKRKYNGKTGEFMGPEHDSTSHAADALRYAIQAFLENNQYINRLKIAREQNEDHIIETMRKNHQKAEEQVLNLSHYDPLANDLRNYKTQGGENSLFSAPPSREWD